VTKKLQLAARLYTLFAQAGNFSISARIISVFSEDLF
jgi:hypothetical protein